MASIGSTIRETRLRFGLTQEELCSGLATKSMMSQIESGKVKPSYHLLRALALRLGLNANDLMDDTEHVDDPTALLRLAEYYVLANDSERAEEILSNIRQPQTRGPQLYDYLRLQAMVHRYSGNLPSSLSTVEEFRENAYRIHDKRLQMRIHQESGYLEYAMNNRSRAIDDWIKAVTFGEILIGELANITDPAALHEANRSMIELRSDLVDLYLSLRDAYVELGNVDEARNCLFNARHYAALLSDLKSVAKVYTAEAQQLLSAQSMNAALDRINNGLAVLKADIAVNRAARAAEDTLSDPVDTASDETDARGLMSEHPRLFVGAELAHIQSLMDKKDYGLALIRVHRSLHIISILREKTNTSTDADWVSSAHTRLKTLEAKIQFASGNTSLAVQVLEAVISQPFRFPIADGRETFANLLGWATMLGDMARVHRILQQYHTWLSESQE